MPTNLEMRVLQKTALYDLILLEKENRDIKGLKILINKTKATMEAEDVAYVEKLIGQL